MNIESIGYLPRTILWTLDADGAPAIHSIWDHSKAQAAFDRFLAAGVTFIYPPKDSDVPFGPAYYLYRARPDVDGSGYLIEAAAVENSGPSVEELMEAKEIARERYFAAVRNQETTEKCAELRDVFYYAGEALATAKLARAVYGVSR